MISYKGALDLIRAAGVQTLLSNETVSVTDIAGRISAADIRASVPNPPFDNAAMDGFALNIAALTGGSSGNPVSLEVAGHIAAGELRRFAPPAPGQCYEIMTGALFPPGCDAVIPVEKTEKSAAGKISILSTVAAGDHIRRAGTDFKPGDIVFQAGTILEPAHVLALATLGIGQISVVRRVRAALISTGLEIVDSLDAPLACGQIYNSTKPYLIAALNRQGVAVDDAGTVRDDPEGFQKMLESLLAKDKDIFISTGAVSAGVHDFVPSVLKEMGAEIFFHKVAIRPGKPLFFAKFPGDGPYYIGLPGNPAATAAGLRFFVLPLLRAMQGLKPEESQYAILKNNYSKGDIPLRFFMRAQLSCDARGLRGVDIPQKQQSFMVSPFSGLNAWAVIPENVSQMKAGDVVEVCQ